MNSYLFAVPIAPGKTETWKNYVKEMTGSRNEDYKKSRKRAGIRTEQVFLQRTPQGDMCVVRLEGDNPIKSLETMIKSNDPFDKWFRDKVLIEAHGLDLSGPMPENESILNYFETPVREYTGSGKSR